MKTSNNSSGKRNGNKDRRKRNTFKGKDLRDDKRYDPKRTYFEDRKSSDYDGRNLFQWYNHNPLLTQAAASIPFPYKPGMQFQIGSDFKTTSGSIVKGYYNIPGVLCFSTALMVGYSDSVTSPISLIAKELYGKVREKFSGTLSVDAPDLAMYMLAMDSIFAEIAAMKRVYRLINTYTPYNYTVPTAVIRAATKSPTLDMVELEQNKVLLWQYINELIGMCKKFFVPRGMDLFDRHIWLFDNVFTDANTPNSQFYLFELDRAYKFALDPEGIGMLASAAVPSNFSSSKPFAQTMYEDVRGRIEALANSEDAYTISGYFMRAYEDRGNYDIPYLDQNEVFTPFYNELVLSQIENARVYSNVSQYNITQDPSSNALICKPKVSINMTNTGNGFINLDPIINIHSDNPSLEDIVEATRFSGCIMDESFVTPTLSGNLHCGTEIINNLFYYGNFDYYQIPSAFYFDTTIAMTSVPFDALHGYLTLSAFDWHPIIPYAMKSTTQTVYGLIGDIHNATVVGVEQMANINKVCLLSEFSAFEM